MTDGSVCGCGLWFVVVVCGLWFLRKIRPTQLWVELSWVVAIINTRGTRVVPGGRDLGAHKVGEKQCTERERKRKCLC